LGWGTENPAYRQVYSTLLIPEGTLEQLAWFNQLQLVSTSPQNAMMLQESFNQVDVQKLAKTIQVPTLVLHAKNDANVPFEEGRIIAANIPAARFVPLASKNHVLLASEPAWPHFWGEFYRFLGIDIGAPAEGIVLPVRDRLLLELSVREREVLRLVAEGYQNAEIAQKLVLSEKTVRNYISNIYAKLQINSRGEAIILARKSGLVDDKA
jgi:DNA-binding CsgD family transcriptional regulator